MGIDHVDAPGAFGATLGTFADALLIVGGDKIENVFAYQTTGRQTQQPFGSRIGVDDDAVFVQKQRFK